MGAFSELKRRNVFRMAVLYVLAAWLVMQVAGVLMDLGGLPAAAGPWLLAVLVIGFPIALVFSWFYELTPEGLALEKDVPEGASITHVTGRRMDFIVIAVLSAGLILFAGDKWWPRDPLELSIAVLPFDNMSADPEQEYFSDGISEEILNLLAQIEPLKVIARHSSFSFKGKDVDIATMAEQMKVRHILEGSVRRSGDRVRITAQLIDAKDSSHLWSEAYDRDYSAENLIEIQSEIALAITGQLRMTLTGDDEAPQRTVIMSASTRAYDAYLRGRGELIGHDVDEAIRHFEHSLRLDEQFAPAHALFAIATLLSKGPTLEERRRIAIRHLDRAQELAPDLAEMHGGRALLELSVDPESAIEHARKALASNPSYVQAMNWLALALGSTGRFEEADAIREQVLIVDPLSITGRYNYGYMLCAKGRAEEAHEIADQIVVQSPPIGYALHAEVSYGWEGKLAEGLFWMLRASAEGYAGNNADWLRGYVWVGEYDEARRVDDDLTFMVDVAEGRYDKAIEKTQRRLQLDPHNRWVIANAANVLYMAGRFDESLPLYESLLDYVPEGRPLPWDHVMDMRCNCMTMRLALARRTAGDEEGAQAALQIAKQGPSERSAAGMNNQYAHRTEAMIAAFEENPEGVIAALRSAIQLGLRDRQVFDDAIFEELRDDPPFVALKQELDSILVLEHHKVLQLICFNNPTPDNWQPLPETCEGVVENSVL